MKSRILIAGTVFVAALGLSGCNKPQPANDSAAADMNADMSASSNDMDMNDADMNAAANSDDFSALANSDRNQHINDGH